MSAPALRHRILLISLFFGQAACSLFGAWTDQSTGLPLQEIFSDKELRGDEFKWAILQDKLGRLFVAGNRLLVFDGQSWRSYPVGDTYALRTLAFDDAGRLWVGAINDVGYFEERALGDFKYHSLIPQLPKEQQLVGDVWGCAQVGRMVYFVCRDKVLRWDGTSFQTLPFNGKSRLFPIKLGDEYWFHHLETGLYRLTEAGPRLEIPAEQLPAAAILGLARDEEGLLLASGTGLYRPGNPPLRISNDELSLYITNNRLASFSPLPDGNYAIGTLTGGMILTNKAGVPLRIINTDTGLPNRGIFSIQPDANGYVWCTTPSGVFNFEGSGHASVFNPFNGLKGRITNLLRTPDSRLFALTLEGVFQLEEIPSDGGRFKPLPLLTATYNHLLPVAGGMLLSRHGGMDFLAGSTLHPVFSFTGNVVFSATPARGDTKTFYLAEGSGLSRLHQEPDGSFVRSFLTNLPDSSVSLLEDTQGRLWLGTFSKGAFLFDPGREQLSPIHDPASGAPFSGKVSIMGIPQGNLFLLDGRMLLTRPDGTGLKALAGAPVINPIVALPVPGEENLMIAFNRANPTSTAAQGLGVLTVGNLGQAQWRELDVPSLATVGFVSTMEFTQENGRPVLWIGGTEGVLRLDYDTIGMVQKPATPFIRLDTLNSGQLPGESGFTFPFQGHRLNFHVFTGDHIRSKGWVLQTRLGPGAWSDPAARRTYEFSNLSEGDYRFEVRTVNPAGLASEPAVFAFRILPPWYRSTGAVAGYLMVLGLGVVAVIRFRERRIRARNRELEALVKIRTAELVKANAAKDEFLAGISHEIRNPMNGVIGIADNFRTDGLDPESRRKFGLLRQCATHLSSLLEDILDFSKVQAGAVEIEAKPFNLPELMESIAAMTAADSEKRGIPVEIAVSPAVPAHLVGDPKRIRQILLNFVSNALKFSGRGQVSVTVWCKTQSPAATEVIFAVSDEGPGISAEEQQRLFTRFERGAAAQQGRVPGTGLGLALCKGLAEKMGGRIWLESEPGRGSCFSFSAPFVIAEPAAAAGPAPSLPRGTKTALVVDDQEYNRLVLSDLLESLGYTVHTAGDGTAALALAGNHAFDAVFLDYNLPGLSGLEVARGIRDLPNKSAGAVILATTAFSTPEKRSQCLAAGMNAFLGKPVTLERLRKALAAAAGPADAATPTRPPPDGLANLRLLAKKKGVPITGELALFLSEFEVELRQLEAAVQREDTAATERSAHLLYGRCAFIGERGLEHALRKIEADCATGHWDDVHRQLGDLTGQVAGLRVRLASSVPVAPPA